MSPVAGEQLRILGNLDLPILPRDLPYAGADLVVDGLIGYSLEGPPRDRAAELIQWANDSPAPILALDAPSGSDTTSGRIFDPAMVATATLTLALPKEGLRHPDASWHVGELYVGDISVPPQLYRRPPLNLDVGPIFAHSDVVRLA
jgi:NAD(P)H-hydrate epimerase